jgi:hypothetical protein
LAAQVPAGPLPFLGSLARSPRAVDRLLWLRVAVDYFLNQATLDPAVNAEFEANFSSCLAGTDDENRLAVARKLVSRGNAPPYLLAAIQSLGGDAALFVQERAEGLSRDKRLAEAQEAERACALARRDDLDDEMIWSIVRGPVSDARVVLVKNARAILSAEAFLDLARRAKTDIEASGDRSLAEALLARTPARSECAPLFLEANSLQRTQILLAVQRAELGKPQHAAASGTPAASDPICRLERYALAGETELFAETLAEILGCSNALATRIAVDRSGEPLAVALAAIGAPNDFSVRILTSNDLRDGADYRRLGALARWQGALNPTAARRVMTAIIDTPQVREDPSATEPALLAAPTPPVTPPSTERRLRPGVASSAREEAVPAAVLRRRRAFEFLAANRALDDKR